MSEPTEGFQNEEKGLEMKSERRGNVAIGNELEDRVGDTAAVEGADGLVVDVSEIFVIEDVEVLWNDD